MLGHKKNIASGVVATVCLCTATGASAGTISQVLDTDGDGIPDTDQSTPFNSVLFDREGIPSQASETITADARIADYAGIPAGTVLDPYLYHEQLLNCLVDVPASTIPGTSIPVAECPQGTGPLALDFDNQTIDQAIDASGIYAGDYLGRFVNVSASGTAGDDSTTSFLNISGSDTDLTGYFEAGITERETEQLVFNVTGPSVPDYIGIDIDLSLAASLSGNLSGSPAGAQVSSSGQVQIIDLDSFQLQPDSFHGSAGMPFSATATVEGSAGQDAVDGTYTVLLRPNRNYEVVLSAIAGYETNSILPTVTHVDFSNLDLTLSASADPSFSLNQEWLEQWLDAGNPEFDLTIDRTIDRAPATRVSEPSGPALLAIGLAGLLVRRRSAQHG